MYFETDRNFSGGSGNMPNLEIYQMGYWRSPVSTAWYPPNWIHCTYAGLIPTPVYWHLLNAEPFHVNDPMEFYWPQSGMFA